MHDKENVELNVEAKTLICCVPWLFVTIVRENVRVPKKWTALVGLRVRTCPRFFVLCSRCILFSLFPFPSTFGFPTSFGLLPFFLPTICCQSSSPQRNGHNDALKKGKKKKKKYGETKNCIQPSNAKKNRCGGRYWQRKKRRVLLPAAEHVALLNECPWNTVKRSGSWVVFWVCWWKGKCQGKTAVENEK